MRLRTIYALPIVVAAAAAGIWWVGSDAEQASQPSEATESIEAESSDDEARQQIQREIQQLRGEVRTLKKRPPQAAAPVADSDDDEPRNGASPKTAEQVDHELSSYHRTEPRDPKWSGETETWVHDLFTQAAFPGTRLVDADCRATLCRVVVASEDDPSFEMFRESMPQTPPFDTQGFVRNIGDEDDPKTVIYFARPGESLEQLLARS